MHGFPEILGTTEYKYSYAPFLFIFSYFLFFLLYFYVVRAQLREHISYLRPYHRVAVGLLRWPIRPGRSALSQLSISNRRRSLYETRLGNDRMFSAKYRWPRSRKSLEKREFFVGSSEAREVDEG